VRAVPEVRTDYEGPAAVLDAWTNVGHGTAAPGVEVGDEDVLGLRIAADAGFGTGAGWLDVIAGVYVEEE